MSVAIANPVGARTLRVSSQRPDECGNPSCGARMPRHKCARCLSACYCSRECQQAHYDQHKASCKSIARQFCKIADASFIGYDITDGSDIEIVDSLHMHARLERAGDAEWEEMLLPVFPDHSSDGLRLDDVGAYAGVSMQAAALRDALNRAHPLPGVVYNIPLLSGMARAHVNTAPKDGPRLSVPTRVTLRAAASTSLPDLLRWRVSSVSRQSDKDGLLSDRDTALVAQELLCLVDKTVFPTLQLMRAKGQRGALRIVVNKHAMGWSFEAEEELDDAGEEIRRCVASYDLDSAVPTLTTGEMIGGGGDDAHDMFLLSPLHGLEALHQQTLAAELLKPMGAAMYRHATQESIDALLRRQRSKYSTPVSVSPDLDESEA